MRENFKAFSHMVEFLQLVNDIRDRFDGLEWINDGEIMDKLIENGFAAYLEELDDVSFCEAVMSAEGEDYLDWMYDFFLKNVLSRRHFVSNFKDCKQNDDDFAKL